MAVFTQSQYDKLKAAIALGALEVKYSDKTVKYRSLTEMLQICKLMEQDLQIGEFAPNAQESRRVGVYNSMKD
jgi:hypothetical protein